MKKALIAVVLGAVLLCGCGKEEKPVATPITAEAISEEAESSEESTKVEESEEAAEESEVPETKEAVISERTVVDGKMQSYFTGEWKDETVVKRRSMAVMMPNNKKAMPQYGLSQASLIYEAPVEGGISRLMAFYEDYDELDHIGPVRSSRDYYIYEAMAYDAIYCNWGLARPYVEELINSDRIDNVSNAVAGIYNPASEAFGRIDRPAMPQSTQGIFLLTDMKRQWRDWAIPRNTGTPLSRPLISLRMGILPLMRIRKALRRSILEETPQTAAAMGMQSRILNTMRRTACIIDISLAASTLMR